MLKFNDYLRVSIADYKISDSSKGLCTLGLGSCIGICIYDVENKIGGLAHIMLPDSRQYKVSIGQELKYADLAIPIMLNNMFMMGCNLKNLRAVIVGGGNMFMNSNISQENSIGFKNQIAVRHILNRLGVPIVCSDLGGNIGKTVYFCLESGDVYVKRGLDTTLLYKGKKGR